MIKQQGKVIIRRGLVDVSVNPEGKDLCEDCVLNSVKHEGGTCGLPAKTKTTGCINHWMENSPETCPGCKMLSESHYFAIECSNYTRPGDKAPLFEIKTWRALIEGI